MHSWHSRAGRTVLVAYSRTFFASIESASIFFSSVFSRSNSFSRFASLKFRCPNCFR